MKDSVTISRLVSHYEVLLDGVLLGPGVHVDVNVYGIVPLELFRFTHDERVRKQGIDLTDEQWKILYRIVSPIKHVTGLMTCI